MRRFQRIVLETGITGGVLFALHASVPNSDSWPMIWPVLAGGTAFWLATRAPEPHRLRTGLAAAFVTGCILGAIAFVGTSIAAYLVVHTAASVRESGAPRGLITAATIAGLAALGVIDLIVAFVAGLLVLPVRYFQLRNART